MRYVQTERAPKAIGPYSQAIAIDNLLFCSGQIPLNPETMQVASQDIEGQTEQVLKNIKGLLASEGLDLNNVVKTTVFLKDMGEFPKMNAIYQKHFGDHRPARSTVEVARLPMDVRVEIECIACKLPSEMIK